MINPEMRQYAYYRYGDENGYGQSTLSEKPLGKVKMTINIASQTIQDNILYKDAEYVGLTHARVDDSFVIDYQGKRLKVLYVNPKGRLNQVFMVTL